MKYEFRTRADNERNKLQSLSIIFVSHPNAVLWPLSIMASR